MQHPRTVLPSVLAAALLLALVPAAAARSFHTWVISELYTSVDGAVQFIELRENLNANGEQFLAGHAITATSQDGTMENTFMFPTNLPSNMTAGRRFLLATANFEALTGITPDYIIPANFLFPAGNVNFAGLAGGADVTYTSLPTDGVQSRNYPGGSIAAATPQRFQGTAGTINVPPGSCCVESACSIASAPGCAGEFTAGGSCSPDPCQAGAAGACCTGTACEVVGAGLCPGGSTYQGDGTVCGADGNPTACCPANFNQEGGVTVQDIFDFLAAYFGNDPLADFNGQGGISVQDIFDFLGAYFAGC